MGRLKPRGLVKTVRGGTTLVRGQLDETAAAPAALLDSPFEHRPADAAGTLAGGNAHALDLAAPHAAPSEPGNKAELQNADDISLRSATARSWFGSPSIAANASR